MSSPIMPVGTEVHMIQKWKTAAVVIIFFAITFALTAQNQIVNGSWEPVVELRDNTNHFPGTDLRPQPAGGWWVTPIHATLLADGLVLLNGWGRFSHDSCRVHTTRQNGESFVIRPADFTGGDGRITEISPIDEAMAKNTQDVLYCSGQLTLSDGTVLFVGGARYKHLGNKPDQEVDVPPNEENTKPEEEYGINYFRTFDSTAKKFSFHDFAPKGSPPVPGTDRTNDGRMWYPTLTRLPANKVLVAGGYDRHCGLGENCYNRDLEIFDGAALKDNRDPWSTWVHADRVTQDMYDPGMKDYTHSFLLYEPIPAERGGGTQREVILTGQSGKITMLSLAAGDEGARLFSPQDSQKPIARPGGAAAWDSSAALVGTGEILIVGGGPNSGAQSRRIDLFNPKTGRWRSKETGITRHNPVATLLPDGTVLIVNGEPGDDGPVMDSRHKPQIFDPYSASDTDNLKTLAEWNDENPLDRGYHSFSLLLQDGRVMIGGGMVGLGQVGCERPDLRIFNPPYLFGGDRPALVEAPEEKEQALKVKIASTFSLRIAPVALRAERAIALMALGSETHSFDQNQRYIPLDYRAQGDGTLLISAPANSTIAPEGLYNLFLISERGVPSPGKIVQIYSE